MPRLLIECTYVFDHPGDNSGIQRVVRNIVNHLDDKERFYPCVPVAIIEDKVHAVKQLKPIKTTMPVNLIGRINRAREILEHVHHRLWHFFHTKRLQQPFASSRIARAGLYLPVKATSLLTLSFIKLLNVLRRLETRNSRVEALEVQPDDILVLLDSSWHSNFFDATETLKKRGLKVVSVIYDLIPLTHPQFCDEGLVRVFESWFAWVTRTADAFICISDTIAEEVRAEIKRRGLVNATGASPWVGHFHLGCDLDLSRDQAHANNETEQFFARAGNTYLTVSTIEPRKNHVYILDAFDLAWSRGLNVKLCIVGKVGWKTEALVRRIRNHPEYGRRLLMLNQASDAELEYAYQEARALIFASFVEGFGLPIVEALHRQLPVIVSDIPVFREVAGEYGLYFDLTRPASLTDKLASVESDSNLLVKADLAGFKWLSWEAATDQFLERLEAGLCGAQDSDQSGKAVVAL